MFKNSISSFSFGSYVILVVIFISCIVLFNLSRAFCIIINQTIRTFHALESTTIHLVYRSMFSKTG